MCKIIEFPVNRVKKIESNGYKNLKALFEVSASVTTCNFYLEAVEDLFQKAEKHGSYLYTPEMGQQEPEGCQMKASLSYYGKHYFIDTPLELKGRGISFIKKYSARDFVDPNNKKIGWNEYQVTKLAYEKLKKQYAISFECALD